MIVCHCEVVNDRDVAEAIDNGARTMAQVSAATGAGRDCGSCVFTLKRLLCHHKSTERATYVEVERAAS